MNFYSQYLEDSCGASDYEEYLEGRLSSALADLESVKRYLAGDFTCPSCLYEGTLAKIVNEKMAQEKESNEWFKQFE
jgi:hypothetical protein